MSRDSSTQSHLFDEKIELSAMSEFCITIPIAFTTKIKTQNNGKNLYPKKYIITDQKSKKKKLRAL
jgi:hypothetical protein